MYARIENNQAVEYPLFEGDLEKRFPQLIFPLDISNTPVPDGYARVHSRQIENYDFTMKYIESMPIFLDGEWVQNWDKVPYSQAEYQQQLIVLNRSMRLKRNSLLEKSDWTMLSDAVLSDNKIIEWKNYRQLLRDIPQQQGFPFNITWPVSPDQIADPVQVVTLP